MSDPDESALSADELKQRNIVLQRRIAGLDQRIQEIKLKAQTNLERLKTTEDQVDSNAHTGSEDDSGR